MVRIRSREELAIKGLDLLLWKSIRIGQFDEPEKTFYRQIKEYIDKCLEKYEFSPSYNHVFTHYVSCLLCIQFDHWDVEPFELFDWQTDYNSEITVENFEFIRSDSDYKTAFTIIVLWAKSRLPELDVRVVYDTFLIVVKKIKQNQSTLPESVHLDFVTSLYLITEGFVCLDFLNNMIMNDIPYLELSTKKLSYRYTQNVSPIMRLTLIEEFNELAKILLRVKLQFGWQVMVKDGHEIPKSAHMHLLKYQFQNPIAQGILCDALNDVPFSLSMLEIVDKQIFASSDAFKIQVGDFDDLIFRSLHFCFDNYQLNLFLDENGKSMRPNQVVNLCAGYHVKNFHLMADEAEADGLYRKAKYVQDIDSKTVKDGEPDTQKLPTVCSFLNTYLFNEHGVDIPAKSLLLAHNHIEKNVENTVALQWSGANQNRRSLNQNWFESQLHINFLPKPEKQPDFSDKPKLNVQKNSSKEQALFNWGRNS